MKRTALNKHIYKVWGKYVISKSIKGEKIHFKTCKTLDEAITYRDKLIANDWEPLPLTPEEIEQKAVKEYYKHIHIHNKRYYAAYNRHDEYLGLSKSIEEVLWFRDLYLNTPKSEVPRIKDVDLQTDNPYIKNGLKYPLPERLILPKRNTTYGTGSVVKKGETSYHIYHGKKNKDHKSYVCACPTYEMAEYVRAEMNKVDWDRSKLQDIIDEYPKYYTKLLFFYQYILKDVSKGKETGKWKVSIPKEYNNGKLEHILYYNLEDALFERDFLKEHDWNYSLLVETIDDSKNPYYDMDLPPYPTRKIRNIRERNYREKELSEIADMVRQGHTQLEILEITGFTRVTISNWLKRFWNSNWQEFTTIIKHGENPLEVLEKVEQIYQPNLSRALPSNWSNWVSYLQRTNTWQVRKGKVIYGTYPTEELAHKISNDLQKVGWDKSKLKEIQSKHGHVPKPFSKRWVYRNGKRWAVRRKDKTKKMITYGNFADKRIAIIVRDMLLEYGFNLDNRDWIVELAEWTVQMQDLLPSTMFGKVTVADIAHIESDKSTSEHYIYESRKKPGQYDIYKSIDGKLRNFGTYPKDRARKVRDFLVNHDWNKDLLKIMQEMGEI